jgi:hypothetical protein
VPLATRLYVNRLTDREICRVDDGLSAATLLTAIPGLTQT